MAITRSQQYKQMLQDGGRIGLRGGGADMGTVSTPSRAARDNREIGARMARTASIGQGDDIRRNREEFETAVGKANLETLRVKDIEPAIGPTSMALNLLKGPRQKLLSRNLDFYRLDPRTKKAREKYGLDAAGYEAYVKARLAGEIDAAGNPLGIGSEGFYPDEIIFPQNAMAQASGIMDQGTGIIEDDINNYRLLAEGGSAGGIMDLEQARQGYKLGKLVKKATRAVKKIVKSPIGKAALLYTGLGGLGSIAGGKTFFANFMNPLSQLKGIGSIFSQQGLGNIASKFGLGTMQTLGPPNRLPEFVPNKLGKFLTSPMGLITGTSLLSGLLTKQQEDDEDEEIYRGPRLDMAAIESRPYDFLNPRLLAEGGSTEKEPVAKKTMPLLDMGGMEKDYRADGGFVPIGRMEKADDVPARLSKNEFVFTADAVRNAGDGDVDKGAEVMYNMMKNLEAGGNVSEESQGLEGARKMFQTSQRLGEVI